MPELPEVETIRRTLRRRLEGRQLERVRVRERRLRQPLKPRSLTLMLAGRAITGVRRRAKYLLVDLEPDRVLLVHLGMSGHLSLADRAQPFAKHDHVVFELSDGWDLRFNDARRFGLVDAFARAQEAVHPRLRHLGYEPFDAALDGEKLHAMTRGRHRPIKMFLMDASKIVGVGNIYASEALFRAGIHPGRPVGRLTIASWQRLLEAVRSTLGDAIDRGGTTLRDYVDPNGNRGEFVDDLAVYGRQGKSCPACGRRVRRLVQSGRSTFYCPGCQRAR